MIDLEKRHTLALLGKVPLAMASAPLAAATAPLTRIAFGSCAHQEKPQPIWDAVVASAPELFVFLGDNIYGDSDDPTVLAAKYSQLAAKPGFQRLRETCAVIATWDDHDYGRNDAGAEYPMREASRELFMNFWKEPAESTRRTHPEGIFGARTLGEPGQRVQILLLDLRWNRTTLPMVQGESALAERDAADMGPYNPDNSPAASMLGETQWQWLEAELRKPAEVRIVASSIQALPMFTGWEAWANFPRERARLVELLHATSDSVNLIISGDVHWCEYSLLAEGAATQPLAELTCSGLTETWDKISPNQLRIGTAHAVPNFGLIEIDWHGARPRLQLSARTLDGSALFTHHYPV